MTTTPVALVHTAPPVNVDAPARPPGRFGLFSVANVVPAPEARFQAGVEFDSLPCGPAEGVSGACVDVETVVLGALGSNIDTVRALPFAVYGWYNCSAFGHPITEAEARARAHLAAGEERAVERAIHAGDLDNQPSFATAVDLTPTGGASMATGIGILEGFIGAEYGGVGVIHMPRRAFSRAQGHVTREGQHLETKLGNYVVAGGGYDIAQDATLDAGNAVLHATAVPVIRRSDVFATPDADFRPNRRNDVVAVAQRVYVVGWECFTVRVTVSLAPEATA